MDERWHPRHHLALLEAHGLRPGDPLMLLNARLGSRHPNLAARPQNAAASLLDDARLMEEGTHLRLVVDLAPDDVLPTRFSASAAVEWSLGPAGPGIPADGRRRAFLRCRVSPLRIDWRASLLARCAGDPRAVRLHEATPVDACRAHDPGLPAAMGALALTRIGDASGLDPSSLLWSRHELPAVDLGSLASAAGIRMAPCPMPDGLVACLAAAQDGLGLCGNREALAAAYQAGLPVAVAVALGRTVDRRILGAPGGLASLVPQAVASPAAVPGRPGA